MPWSRHPLPREHAVPLRGVQLGYRRFGSGPPVILVHGSFTARPFGKFEERLAKKRTVVAIDLPGFGSSDAVPGARHAMPLFVEALGVAAKALGIVDAPIVAFSYGSIVAMHAMAQGVLKGPLVAIGTPGKVFGLPSRLFAKLAPGLRTAIVRSRLGIPLVVAPVLGRNTGERNPAQAARMFEKLFATDARSMAEPDYLFDIETGLRRDAPKLRGRVHLVYGERDPQRGTASDVLTENVTIPGVGHTPFREAEKTAEAVFAGLASFGA
jgi:pimeloyl-ACP methyl ester carboxylesterase